ncbi:MAG: pyrrolo-quinoline quinone [Verrucomicrobia bacterium]|nr:pyrrolo-quinoline quinone [Verrucomicrobiota bacterium]
MKLNLIGPNFLSQVPQLAQAFNVTTALCVLCNLFVSRAAASEGANWPSFRGPQATGVAEGHKTPEKWDVERGGNTRWKTRIPGLGHSCPVIWENRLFVTTAATESDDANLRIGLYGDIQPVTESFEHRWTVYCLNKTNGSVLWKEVAHTGIPKIKRHPKSSHANSTPATDGKHVVAFFGAEGLFCFDMDGKRLWQKELGPLDSGYFVVPAAQWGFASSPIIHQDRVIVQCDVQTNSFLAAFEIKDGKEVWRTRRADVPTWSTPTIETGTGRTQILINGFKHTGGYDFATGKEIWKLTGGGDIPVPTPIVAHGLTFMTSSHGPVRPIYAIRNEAKGDITLASGQSTNQYIVWSQTRGGNYMQTPIVYGDYLYCSNDAGVLACYRAKTGENLYTERLGDGRSGFTASAVAADQKIYFTSEQGTVSAIKAGPKFEVLARNEMGESCMATPAISGGALFFRTRHHVVMVAEK